MAFQSGKSGEDGESYAISTNNLKSDEVPDICMDAKSFAEFMAGLLNAYFSDVDALAFDPEKIAEMGRPEIALDIPHRDNPEIPF